MTIAFPALGAGNLGYPPGRVAEIFFSCIQRVKPKSLKEVRIVIFTTDHDNFQVPVSFNECESKDYRHIVFKLKVAFILVLNCTDILIITPELCNKCFYIFYLSSFFKLSKLWVGIYITEEQARSASVKIAMRIVIFRLVDCFGFYALFEIF